MAGDGDATGQRRWRAVTLALPVLLLGVGIAFYLGHRQVPETPRASGPTVLLPLNGQPSTMAPIRPAPPLPSPVHAEPLPQRAEAVAPVTSGKASLLSGSRTAAVAQTGHAASQRSQITHPSVPPLSSVRHPPLAVAGPAHPAAGWYVQVGAFSAPRPARQLLERVRSRGFSGRLAVLPDSALQHVWIGPLPDRAAALAVTARVRQDLRLSGFPRHWP